jgi:hypothetical protein
MPEETTAETTAGTPGETIAETTAGGAHAEPGDASPAEGGAARAPQHYRGGGDADEVHAVLAPLRRLVELALAHPDIGPPLADLAFAIGQREVAEQLVRLGTERAEPRLEYFVVASHAARRRRGYPEALKLTLDALRALRDHGGSPDDGDRVLQLVRTGLSVLMFDLKDLAAEPGFTRGLAEALPALDGALGEQPLYRTLLAQALWFTDKDASEREWERARELVDPASVETVWNARGTWYKEADRDLDKAERAYRRGLEHAPESALLLHNLAQVLVERAEHAPSPGLARHLLNQAQDLLRRTLRADVPRLRRHIHATRDRLEAVRRSVLVRERESYAEAPAQAPSAPPAGGAPDRPRPPRQYPQGQAPQARPMRDERRGPDEHRGPDERRADEHRAPDARRPDARRPDDRRPDDRRGQDRRPDDRRGQDRRPDDRRGPAARGPDPRKDPGQAFLRSGTVTLGDILKAKLGLAQAPAALDKSQKDKGDKKAEGEAPAKPKE